MIIESQGSGFSFFIRSSATTGSGTEWLVADDQQIIDVLRTLQLASPLAIRLIQVARSTDQSTFNEADRAILTVLNKSPEAKSRLEQSKHSVQDLIFFSKEVVRHIAQNVGVYEIPTSYRD